MTKLQKHRGQPFRVNALNGPTNIEILGELLDGDEATINKGAEAPCSPQILKGLSQTSQELSSPLIRSETPRKLRPRCAMSSRGQSP